VVLHHQADGRCAWRGIDPINPLSSISTQLPASFDESEFSSGRLGELKQSMHTALVSSGLYDDEAKAMLDTWELSYFKSSGARIFYIVPPAWTEQVLPMRISPKPDEIKRVMVGRLDVVTPEQRELLKQIVSAGDVAKEDAKLWEVYDRLGRFRNALVLDELQRTQSPALKQFIANHGLHSFTPAPVQQNASASARSARESDRHDRRWECQRMAIHGLCLGRDIKRLTLLMHAACYELAARNI
jgi:hypothetical protein